MYTAVTKLCQTAIDIHFDK